MGRREFVVGTGLGLAMTLCAPATARENGMYGLIGKMSAQPGKRDELIGYLLENDGGMPGCLSYIVAKDPADADAIWITEVWTDTAAHQASLTLPGVQEAIRKARPLIAGFSDRHELEPVGGIGLSR